MKKFLVPLTLVLALAWFQPFALGHRSIVIPRQAPASQIADRLCREHVLRSKIEFLAYLKLSSQAKRLRSGTFELQRYKPPYYYIRQLTHGGATEIMATIPEGLTIYEIANVLASKGLGNRDEFLRLCRDRNFIQNLGFTTGSLEGFLFPDTYSFTEDQTDSAIISVMINNFQSRLKKYALAGDSLNHVVILASLVEKEAKFDDERPIIARVFLNRLKLGRPLESCATVIYAMKNNPYDLYTPDEIQVQGLTEKDLKIESPYNTYLHPGLPPGPICCPGIRSIDAVLNPADVDYLYFVAKGDGRHQFSRTYKEHLAAKERYLD